MKFGLIVEARAGLGEGETAESHAEVGLDFRVLLIEIIENFALFLLRIAPREGRDAVLDALVLLAEGLDQVSPLRGRTQELEDGETAVDLLLDLSLTLFTCLEHVLDLGPVALVGPGDVVHELLLRLPHASARLGKVLAEQSFLVLVLFQRGDLMGEENFIGAFAGPTLRNMRVPTSQFARLGLAKALLKVTAGQGLDEVLIGGRGASVQRLKHFVLLRLAASEAVFGRKGAVVGIVVGRLTLHAERVAGRREQVIDLLFGAVVGQAGRGRQEHQGKSLHV